MPRGVRKRIKIGPRMVRAPAGARNKKKTPQIIFNDPISSIKPGTAPDPLVLVVFQKESYTLYRLGFRQGRLSNENRSKIYE